MDGELRNAAKSGLHKGVLYTTLRNRGFEVCNRRFYTKSSTGSASWTKNLAVNWRSRRWVVRNAKAKCNKTFSEYRFRKVDTNFMPWQLKQMVCWDGETLGIAFWVHGWGRVPFVTTRFTIPNACIFKKCIVSKLSYFTLTTYFHSNIPFMLTPNTLLPHRLEETSVIPLLSPHYYYYY